MPDARRGTARRQEIGEHYLYSAGRYRGRDRSGRHFDFIERGQGIVDDWRGASLVPSLYQALANPKRHHTYAFVAAAAEERDWSAANVRAFVNMDCLGAGEGVDASRTVGITQEGVNGKRSGVTIRIRRLHFIRPVSIRSRIEA